MTLTTGTPIDGAGFADLMAPFEPFEARPALAVAVSGGRDSLALALLSHDWAVARGGRVLCLIVDHGLRPQSAEEAAATVRVLAREGIEALVLFWAGEKPQSSLQEAARAARYGLLQAACRERDMVHLLVAHHAEDQAETVAMRAARLSGPDGLAGMAALVELPEVRLLRPLLGERRARLSATLAARNIPWIDDPSNADLRFERARLRSAGLPLERPPKGASDERAWTERRLAEVAIGLLEFDQEGAVAIDCLEFARFSLDARQRLLSRLVQAIGGRNYPPRRNSLERAGERLCGLPARGKSGRGGDFTLSGCRLELRQTGTARRLRWIIRSENGRKGGPPLIPAAFFACSETAPYHLD